MANGYLFKLADGSAGAAGFLTENARQASPFRAGKESAAGYARTAIPQANSLEPAGNIASRH